MIGDMSNDNERRSTPRVPFASPITVRIGNESYSCRTRDLGTGGIFVYFDGEPPALTTRVDIELQLGDASVALLFEGRVARYGSGGNGIGVAFVEVSAEARENLSAYVATTL
jgi:hypothetical protein